jgi:RND family efflux transporter MFP subunit
MERDKTIKLIKIIGLVVIVFFLIDLVARYKTYIQAPHLPIPQVVAQKPEKISMSEYMTQTGTTVAYNAVNLVARVEGYLDAIKFVDGTFVKKGQPLFVIQPEPYMEQLRAAKASVEAQKAALAYSKAEYARQQRMYKENATSLNSVEKWLAKSHESEAEVDKAEANQVIAEINYGYTHIDAPFDGRIGRHLVDINNLVGNGVATNLATIEQLDPIYVYFNLNELDLLRIKKMVAAQGKDAKQFKSVPVAVRLQGDANYHFEGLLDFVNTGLNAATGTMEFRAVLPNKTHALVPGLFVQVRVAITKETLQLTVPDTAVLYDQIGAYLLTVDKQNLVQLKRVVLGALSQEKRAILKGLNADDDVIVDGLQYATPGKQVQPQHEKNVK